jgi:hypothetical protein
LGLPIVFNIIGNQYLFPPMNRAMFYQVYALILKDNFCLHLSQTFRAKAIGEGIEEIGASRHRINGE